MTTLYIKNMVCPRCIKVVQEELEKLNYPISKIQLGTVDINQAITDTELLTIRNVLSQNGFELLDDKKLKTIERIKILIIEGIRSGLFFEMNKNISQYLSEELNMEYTHLSSLFSSVEGKTIERFVILHKIERIKELIIYNELSIKEIADSLGYSSLQALSNQFKKETGITPSEFKKVSTFNNRKSIDEV
ncbi:MAG: AraC family transcriptional regulator [Cytophagaceae bacterium]